MTPTLVHRYAFPIREAVEALLGDAVGDCEGWRIRIEGEEVVVDVIAPVAGIAPTLQDVVSLGTETDTPSVRHTEARQQALDSKQPTTPPDGEEPKGGPLSRQAAMLCDNAGFRTFIGVIDKEAARAAVLRRCGVTSRRYLDHDPRAAEVWRDIEGKFSLWKDGYDVELEPLI